MRLTLWTDYSLRVLMYCAAHHGRDPPVTISEIQQAHGISRHHLTKVVMSLAGVGYLETTRGRGGGLRLLVPASEISVAEVVRHSETDFRLVECFDPAVNTCRLDGQCRLKSLLQEATAHFFAVLDGMTLEALVTPAMRRFPLVSMPVASAPPRPPKTQPGVARARPPKPRRRGTPGRKGGVSAKKS